MVSAALVEELRLIIKEDYQVDLQPQEAVEIANTLVDLFSLLTELEFESDNNQTEEGGVNEL